MSVKAQGHPFIRSIRTSVNRAVGTEIEPTPAATVLGALAATAGASGESEQLQLSSVFNGVTPPGAHFR